MAATTADRVTPGDGGGIVGVSACLGDGFPALEQSRTLDQVLGDGQGEILGRAAAVTYGGEAAGEHGFEDKGRAEGDELIRGTDHIRHGLTEPTSIEIIGQNLRMGVTDGCSWDGSSMDMRVYQTGTDILASQVNLWRVHIGILEALAGRDSDKFPSGYLDDVRSVEELPSGRVDN